MNERFQGRRRQCGRAAAGVRRGGGPSQACIMHAALHPRYVHYVYLDYNFNVIIVCL